MGVDLMHDQLEPFGFGAQHRHRPRERGHRHPAVDGVEARYYKQPEQQKWYAGETISLGIGQGYNNFTMLQLASATATLVSGGQRYKPRLVREVENVMHARAQARRRATRSSRCRSSPSTWQLIRRALHGVTQEGTSARVVRRRAVPSGGKTGTAQAVGVRPNEKYNAAKLEEHKRDHALYIAVRADRRADRRAGGGGRERRLRLGRRRADRAPRVRLPAARPVSERRRHRPLTRLGKSSVPVGTPRQADARAAARRAVIARPAGRAARHAAGDGRAGRRLAHAAASRARCRRPADADRAAGLAMSVVVRQAVAVAAHAAGLQRLRRPAASGLLVLAAPGW